MPEGALSKGKRESIQELSSTKRKVNELAPLWWKSLAIQEQLLKRKLEVLLDRIRKFQPRSCSRGEAARVPLLRIGVLGKVGGDDASHLSFIPLFKVDNWRIAAAEPYIIPAGMTDIVSQTRRVVLLSVRLV